MNDSNPLKRDDEDDRTSDDLDDNYNDDDNDDDADDEMDDDDRKRAATLSDSSNHNDATNTSSSIDGGGTSTTQPAATYQQQIKKRNAIYSKRKYYKKKKFIDGLKQTKVQLVGKNKKLHESNNELERMLHRAKQMIAVKQNNQMESQILSQHYRTLPSQLPPSLASNSSALSSITRSLLQQQQHQLPYSITSSIARGSNSDTNIESSILTSTGLASRLSTMPSQSNHRQTGLTNHEHNVFANLKVHGSTNFYSDTGNANQQYLPDVSMATSSFISNSNNMRLAQLLSSDEQREAFRRNLDLYSSSTPSLPPTTRHSPFESPLLSLMLQQELANRSGTANRSLFPYEYLNDSLSSGGTSNRGEMSVHDILNGSLRRDVPTGIGNQLTQSLFDNTVAAPTPTLRQLLLAQELQQQQQQQQAQQRRSATIANSTTVSAAQQNQINDDVNTALLEYYLSIARRR